MGVGRRLDDTYVDTCKKLMGKGVDGALKHTSHICRMKYISGV